VNGTLTLLGVTRPVTLEVSHFNCGFHPMLRKQVCGANLAATLKRSEYGMTKYLPMVGDDVRVAIAVEAFKD
jgi:polyisoprenoid-binding protein YceI